MSERARQTARLMRGVLHPASYMSNMFRTSCDDQAMISSVFDVVCWYTHEHSYSHVYEIGGFPFEWSACGPKVGFTPMAMDSSMEPYVASMFPFVPGHYHLLFRIYQALIHRSEPVSTMINHANKHQK